MSVLDDITCKLIKNKRHLLFNAKTLPCQNTACQKCIQKVMNKTNYLRCNFVNCKERHAFADLNKVPNNENVERYIRENLSDVTSEMHKSLNDRLVDVTETTHDYEFHLETRLDYALNEIDIKIESLHIELDNLVNSIETSIFIVEEVVMDSKKSKRDLDAKLKAASIDLKTRRYMKNLYKSLKKHHKIERLLEIENEFKASCIELDYFVKLFQRKGSASHSNSTVRVRNMYTCEGLMKKFLDMNSNFTHFVIQVLYPHSSLVIVTSMLGKFIDPNILSLDSLENTIPIVLKFDQFKCMKNLCALNDSQLLLSDSKANTIYMFDREYRIQQQFSRIDEKRLEYPVGICADATNTFICDHDNSRMIISDRKFQRIYHTFGKHGKAAGEFDCPIEACLHSSSLFVLDRGNRRIQEFTTSGNYLRNIRLYKVEQSKTNIEEVEIVPLIFPLSFKISFNKMAVISVAKVYIYNFEGTLIQTLAPNNITCICFLNEKLFTLNNDSFLTCYSCAQGNSKEHQDFIESYSHRFDALRVAQFTSMLVWNSNLVLCADNAKLLAII